MKTCLGFLRASRTSSMATSCLLLAGCGGSRNPVDQFLDQYEEIVKEWESKGSSLSLDDLNELNKADIDFAEKAKNLQTADQGSSEQMNRYSDPTTRFSKVMLKMSQNPPKIAP